MGPLGAADPWSAGIMALGSVATKAVTPGSAQQGVGPYSSTFDTSGWSLNFGSGSSSATASTATGAAPAALAGLSKNPLVLVAIVVGLALYLKK